MDQQTPWGPVGYITYKRTYARRLKKTFDPSQSENSQDVERLQDSEEWPDTINRVICGIRDQLKLDFSPKEEDFFRRSMLLLKGSVAGRFLWQLGTKTVDRLGLLSLQNCALTVVNDPIRPFTWTMDALMLGCGVGYNIQREFIAKLPQVKKVVITRNDASDADFIVPDNREGWVELLRKTLKAHFITGKSFSFSTICIRSKGAPIRGFGGVASGPEELCQGILKISEILNRRAGGFISTIEALDMMNIIGSIVVAGNVRRSAQLALGDMDDDDFMRAKRWDLGTIPNWRSMSNNSVVCNDIHSLPASFWDSYDGNGEPYGLINLELSRKVGRLGETQYPDPDVMGYNPCGEQSLAPYETCCLSEIFLPHVASYDEMMELTRLLYRINKHSLALNCHAPETEAIVHRHMRMGIGITGYMQASEVQKSWLSSIYAELRDYDRLYSDKNHWPTSIKLTTVKPSGTLSLLAGVTPGCHPAFSHYFIRRIRVAAGSRLVDHCRKHGYHVEPQINFDGTQDPSTVVVEFPCSYPPHTKVARDITAVDQLEHVKWLQTNWSDNSVSCTIYYEHEELPQIKSWLLKNYNEGIKTCSFLLKQKHGFVQAPYEEISKAEFEELSSRVRPITQTSIDEDAFDVADCDHRGCPVR
jgi:ribonucleoside-triphosphate reductase